MASASNSQRIFDALIAVACSAALFWFGNGLNPLWPLMWFAPLPVLLFATRGSWWASAITAWLAIMAGGLSMWRYFSLLHIPWLATYAVIATVFTLDVLLLRALLRRGAYWSALLAFPAFWVTCEYVANLVTPNGTAGSLAYTQLKFLPFLQVASVTGPWGMTFLLLLFPAALAVGEHLLLSSDRKTARVICAAALAIVVVLIFGDVRLRPPASQQKVKVGLIASDAPANDDVAAAGAPTERLLRDYAAQAENLASQGAQVIVLPEKLGVFAASDATAIDAIFQDVANKTGSTIVVGMVTAVPPLKYNQARIYSPNAPIVSYNKQHMLPPFESNLTPGNTLTLISGHPDRWGVAICKDMDFTPLSRQYGKAGAGLMLVPGWDFNLDRGWHGNMAIMRGVEDGFNIAHSAKNGYLTASDTRGRILAQTRSDSAPFATLIAQVPTQHDQTAYQILGDWFAWLSMAILLWTLIRLIWVLVRKNDSNAATIPQKETIAG